MRRISPIGAVAVLERDAAGQGADAVGGQISRGVDAEDARSGTGGGRIDAGDRRRGVRAAQHDTDGGVGQRDIVGIATDAEQEAGIFDAANGLGNAKFSHGSFSPKA